MPGSNASALEKFLSEGFVGVDFGITRDLTGRFPDEFREFSSAMIPVIQELRPEKTKVSAGDGEDAGRSRGVVRHSTCTRNRGVERCSC